MMNQSFIKNFILMLVLWIGLTFWAILQYDKSFFILTYAHSDQSFVTLPDGKITKGKKVVGIIKAQENNFGSVSLNFNVGRRIAFSKEDKLIFRIKEKSAKDWYYENVYRSGMMYDEPFYPFGFTPIANSKNKMYLFEIISTNGNLENAHAIKKSHPTIESRYVLNKGEVLKDPKKIIAFLFKKFYYKITTLELVFFSLIVSLPLISYLIWASILFKKLEKTIKKNKYIGKILASMLGNFRKSFNLLEDSYYVLLFISILIAVFADTLLIHIRTNLIYVVVFFMWLKSLSKNKLADIISIFSALAFLIISATLDIFSKNTSAIKAGAWSLIFLAAGVTFLIKRRKFFK